VRITVYGAQAIAEAAAASVAAREEIARQIAADARAAAPVQTGEFRDGINADGVLVVDDDPEAVYKEYGVAHRPAHATLTDAARRYGKYTGWQPKRR
jgi:hypothetical protein